MIAPATNFAYLLLLCIRNPQRSEVAGTFCSAAKSAAVYLTGVNTLSHTNGLLVGSACFHGGNHDRYACRVLHCTVTYFCMRLVGGTRVSHTELMTESGNVISQRLCGFWWAVSAIIDVDNPPDSFLVHAISTRLGLIRVRSWPYGST